MRIVIIGASGFVGSALCRRLGEKHEVIGTYRKSTEPILGCRQTIQIDISQAREVEALFQNSSFEAIYHLAYDLDDLHGSVVRGTKHLLTTWQQTNLPSEFFYISTGSVFDGETGPFSEYDKPKPITDYGKAKREAEKEVLAAGGMIIRTALVYGITPPDHSTKILMQGLQSETFRYPYFTDEIRCPVYVDDLADSLAECLSSQTAQPVLHIAGPESMSRHELARNIAQATGYNPEAVPAAKLSESGLIRPRDLTLDNSLTRQLLSTRCRPVHEALMPLTSDPDP